MQFVLDMHQLVTLALHHARHWNAGRPRHYFGNFLRADLGAQQTRTIGHVAACFGLGGFLQLRFQLRFQLRQAPVLQFGHLVELAFALQTDDLRPHVVDLFLQVRAALHRGLFRRPDFLQIRILAAQFLDLAFDQLQTPLRGLVLFLLHRLALDLQLDQAAVEPVHHLGLGVNLHLDLGSGFVDQVDRLVRQEAIGNVAMAELRRGDDGRIGNVDPVVQLVLLLQTAQDRDRRFDRRFVDQHFLEAAFERGILLDVLAVFVQRGCAYAMQLAAR